MHPPQLEPLDRQHDLQPLPPEDPEGCSRKRRFSAKLAHFITVGAGVLYSEYGQDREPETRVLTLRHARLAGDSLLEEGGAVIAEGVGTRLVFARGVGHVVFTVSSGDMMTAGLYAYGPLPAAESP